MEVKIVKHKEKIWVVEKIKKEPQHLSPLFWNNFGDIIYFEKIDRELIIDNIIENYGLYWHFGDNDQCDNFDETMRIVNEIEEYTNLHLNAFRIEYTNNLKLTLTND